MSEHSFTDPYESLSRDELLNTTIEVSQRDHAYLKGLFPHRSVLQTTINILLSRFITACKKHGLREYDPIKFQSAITNATVSIRDGSAVVSNPIGTDTDQSNKAHQANDGRRTGEVGHKYTGLPVATPDTPSRVPSGVKSKKTKKGNDAGTGV